MADLRYDPVTDIWVAMANKRRERPMEFVPVEQVHPQIICPFCAGNEEETPDPIFAYRSDGNLFGPGDDPSSWAVRIMPNKFPSLSQAEGGSPSGPYRSAAGDGVQELVIPTPKHVSSLGDLSNQELAFCLGSCQNRIEELRNLKTIEHVMLFLNCGSAAGASMEHIHFQIMGSPVLSTFLQRRFERNAKHFEQTGHSLIGSVLDWELEQSKRVLQQTENFVMFCPYASRFAFQVWIVPRNREMQFTRLEKSWNNELAELCRGYVGKLEGLMDNPAYNLLLNLSPNRYRDGEHWFIEIFPRLNRMAGFELGTDVWVNPVPPELAARRLSS